MPRKEISGNLALTSYDALFESTTKVAAINEGHIVEIALGELYAPEDHPFLVKDDDAMSRLSESVKRYGVREPGLARSRQDGGYELLCGNRRKRACELAGQPVMPVIIRILDDVRACVEKTRDNRNNHAVCGGEGVDGEQIRSL